MTPNQIAAGVKRGGGTGLGGGQIEFFHGVGHPGSGIAVIHGAVNDLDLAELQIA